MTDYANFIRFGENNTLTGNIASISYDLDITGKENRSTNPDAPVYRLFAKSPRGRQVEIGAIWQRKNQSGGDYYSLSINTAMGGSMPTWAVPPVRTTKTSWPSFRGIEPTAGISVSPVGITPFGRAENPELLPARARA